MNGSDDTCVFEYENLRGEVKQFATAFEGILPMVRRRYREASSDMMRDQFGQFMTVKPCSTCHGARLRHEALAIKIGGLNIAELTDLPVSDMIPFFDNLKLTEKQQLIGKQIFKEIKARLNFLQTVGLDYMTLSRTAGTLSGGEAQRIRLATQIQVEAWSASSISWTNHPSACTSGTTTSSWKPSSACATWAIRSLSSNTMKTPCVLPIISSISDRKQGNTAALSSPKARPMTSWPALSL